MLKIIPINNFSENQKNKIFMKIFTYTGWVSNKIWHSATYGWGMWTHNTHLMRLKMWEKQYSLKVQPLRTLTPEASLTIQCHILNYHLTWSKCKQMRLHQIKKLLHWKLNNDKNKKISPQTSFDNQSSNKKLIFKLYNE